VSKGEVICCQVGSAGVAIDELGIGIIEDLSITVVFHHDQEHVVKMGDAFWNGPLLRMNGGGE